MIALSERESNVLRLVQRSWEACKETPTVMELSRQAGIYYMEVLNTLRTLDEKGFIELTRTTPVTFEPLWWE
jgi:sugar-specific transcriptional regulator TrmB